MDVDPTRIGQTLTRDYHKAQKMFRQAIARQFVIGRQLVEVRETLGKAAFAQWLARFCPSIPLEDAEALITYSLHSGLAHKVDQALGDGDSSEGQTRPSDQRQHPDADL